MIRNEIMRQVTASSGETEKLASDFAKILKSGDFVAMYGDLGAGKTAFTRGLVNALIPEAEFAGSPTYALVNEYEGENLRLSHFDMYRITDEDDLYSIGFFDYTNSIIVTEWSENIEYALPGKRYEVRISKLGENEREIVITQTEE